MNALVNASRRTFLKAAGISGGGLVIGFSLTGCSDAPLPVQTEDMALMPNAFLQITADNTIRFYCPQDEMGQGVTTGLATLVAEELDVAPHNIEVHFAGAHSDYNNPDMGMQGTGGSTSIKAHYLPLRQAAADTRATLLQAAATELGVPHDSIKTDNAQLIVGDKSYPYGKFAAAAARLPVAQATALKPKTQFKYIGKEFARIDAAVKSTGTAVYGIDVDIPGMHHAVVKRCPVAGGRLRSVDKTRAAGMPGVTDIVEISAGMAVVAEKFWQAKQAAAQLDLEWDLPEFAKVSSEQIESDYRRAIDEEGDVDGQQGDIQAGFDSAQTVIEQQYWAPYLAHAPLEPMNAVARIADGEADIWVGTQMPGILHGLVAREAGIDKQKIRIHNTYMGGGFGRRGVSSHVIEAVQTAVQTGKPIQVIWTREDDMQNGFYRPASLMRISSGVDADGNITAWSAKRVGGNIMPDVLATALPGMLPGVVPEPVTQWIAGLSRKVFDGWTIDHVSIEGLYEDYDFPNREVRHVTVNHGLPLTFWRSVGHSYTAFAKESMIDELAEQSGMDAVSFRIRNLNNNPRLQNVVRIVGEKMQHNALPNGHAVGFAAHGSFGSYVSQAAEVSVDSGKIRVHKVICAVDCGQVVNPDIVRGQMEGAIMFGLTAALYGDLQIKNGTVVESNFHNYPILRMNEAPAVEVIIIDSDAAPTGVGEPGLPPIAPAVANAVYAATGKRLRSMPLKLT